MSDGPPGGEIRHVSDTALMAAACRALETERTGGLVNDPFARALAGDRGLAIARSVPLLEVLCLGIGIRTRFLDERVMEAVTNGQIRLILSLGAGLDTRPWRLDLPANVRWIEVDFPPILDYKRRLMADHSPHCRLERLPVDLSDPLGRHELYAAAGPEPALLITEGLLIYLPAETVEALAGEVAASTGARTWLLDLASRQSARRLGLMNRMERLDLETGTHLDATEILERLDRHGWKLQRSLIFSKDLLAAAPERVKALAESLPRPEASPPPTPDDPSGVYEYTRD